MRTIAIISLIISFLTKGFCQTKQGKANPRTIIFQSVIKSIVDKNKDSLTKYVNFPLQGDIADIPELNGTKESFFKTFDEFFTYDIRQALKNANDKSFTSTKSDDGTPIYFVDVSYLTGNKHIGHDKKRGIILQIKKYKNIYKLYKFEQTTCK